MSSISGRHDGRAALVTIAIIDAANYRNHKASRTTKPLKGAVPFRALIDTGATRTMITKGVALRLNLQLVNKIPFASIDGTSNRNGYLFQVGFYRSPPRTDTEVSNISVFKNVTNGGELPDGVTFDVLLGMDIITSGDLHIKRDGAFKFDF